MTATEYVILVDEEDKQIGVAEKLEAHEKNLLHRAFSIFVFKEKNRREVLLQQRAQHKYHSPGLWTNSCCSHPKPGESVIAAGQRRLQEELGFVTELQEVGCFQYNAHFSNGLSEHELDHVLIGVISSDEIVLPNPEEVQAWKWVNVDDLLIEINNQPEKFTPWLKQALEIAVRM